MTSVMPLWPAHRSRKLKSSASGWTGSFSGSPRSTTISITTSRSPSGRMGRRRARRVQLRTCAGVGRQAAGVVGKQRFLQEPGRRDLPHVLGLSPRQRRCAGNLRHPGFNAEGRNETGPHHSLADWARPRNMYGNGGSVERNGRSHAPTCGCSAQGDSRLGIVAARRCSADTTAGCAHPGAKEPCEGLWTTLLRKCV